jgi:NAD(P)H-dependent FMN reductase
MRDHRLRAAVPGLPAAALPIWANKEIRMSRLIGLSGSLRKASFNAALLRAAVEQAPDGVEIVAASIHGIPLYDADVEAADGVPEAVTALKEQIAGADGLMLFTPEYNNGIPGVFKNAIDWLSRPPKDIARVFGGKPVALCGASPGGFGTVLSQTAWLPVLRILGTRPWFGTRLTVARANTLFDADGRLTDDATRQQLQAFVQGFADFVARR